MPAPFPIDPHLTAIAIAYKNSRMISDSVLPRVPVGKSEFKYQLYDLRDGFTVPDTKVGRKSEPNQVEFGSTQETDSTVDYGLDDFIPQSDLDNAAENQDPEGQATMSLTNLIELDREIRTADLVFDGANYGTANKQTLSGSSQWSDFSNSTPLADLMDALDSMIMRANIAVFGREVYTKLAQHPDIVKAFHGTSGDSGIVPPRFLADLLELDEVLVGQGRVNVSKPGQAASLNRVWGKHVSLIYRDELASADRGTTFGLTAQFGDRVSRRIIEEKKGLNGGQTIRVGESVKELITANDLGYFIQDAVA